MAARTVKKEPKASLLSRFASSSNSKTRNGPKQRTGAGKPVNELAKRLAGSSKTIKKVENPLAKSIRTANQPLSVEAKLRKLQNKSNKVTKTPKNASRATNSLLSSNKASTALNNKASKPKKSLTIKNISLPKFLRIKNLAYATSAEDIALVFKQHKRQVVSARVKDLPTGSTVAEVTFQNENDLKIAQRLFDGTTADGRVLSAEIATTSEIV